ncbi:hypothetical protein AAMO2058_001242500 [Amorphochlora amoebiformis]|mmetsp:Transcript_23740/g.37334  ORF Transcript_23740/g.37334 Transcript_23740/m.37334 type:complete len:413 (-) Transcript_23740:62-1300(-)
METSNEVKTYPSGDDVKRLKAEVIKEHPDAEVMFQDCWSNDYIKLVMSQPSKEKPNEMRTFDYSVKKLCKAFEKRKKYGVDKLMSGKRKENSKENSQEDSEKIPGNFLDFSEPPDVVREGAESGSLYWKDYDKEGRPILWVHNNRKDWANINVERQRQLHIWMIEMGIRYMPEGVNQFVIIADTGNMSIRQMCSMSYTRMLIKVFMTLYPDRVAYLLCGPVSMLLKKLYNLCSPLLPTNVQRKIRMIPAIKENLMDYLREETIPQNFGGKADHSALFEEFETNISRSKSAPVSIHALEIIEDKQDKKGKEEKEITLKLPENPQSQSSSKLRKGEKKKKEKKKKDKKKRKKKGQKEGSIMLNLEVMVYSMIQATNPQSLHLNKPASSVKDRLSILPDSPLDSPISKSKSFRLP